MNAYRSMSPAARSIFVYAIYLIGLGFTLLLVPNIPLPIFGLPQATEVWIRVLGMTIVTIAIFYFTAARYEYRPIFVSSVVIRLYVPLIFIGFIVAGFAPWNLILLTPLDVVFAAWTWVALRSVPQVAPAAGT